MDTIANSLSLYDTYTRKVRRFQPLVKGKVTLYLCGPTVYNSPHLGNALSAITIDLLYRYLKHIGYQVNYVRNITDVGHFTDEHTHEGEDKLIKKAAATKSTPFAVADHYTRLYHEQMGKLNTLPPHIEPRASGHISHQIESIQKLIDKGYAYEIGGSVYFDISRYNQSYNYGALSGRKIEELRIGSRHLTAQTEKKHQHDFALWKRAPEGYPLQWSSPWGKGFPGWHIECTAMSSAHLGTQFDIHAGGLDLKFPHHECEMAQHQALFNTPPANYWFHHNLIEIEGRKMGKSAGNAVTIEDCFTGNHLLCQKAYQPMALRLLILQSHYRQPIQYSEKALHHAERAYYKLINTYHLLMRTEVLDNTSTSNPILENQIENYLLQCQQAMDNDLNTPQLLATLYAIGKEIHKQTQQETPSISQASWKKIQTTYHNYLVEILGINPHPTHRATPLLPLIIKEYQKAKEGKKYIQVDKIRKSLAKEGIELLDSRKGIQWYYKPITHSVIEAEKQE